MATGTGFIVASILCAVAVLDCLSSVDGQGGQIHCFRKLHGGGERCRGVKRRFSSAEACCNSRKAQGYALQRVQSPVGPPWFDCVPCSASTTPATANNTEGLQRDCRPGDDEDAPCLATPEATEDTTPIPFGDLSVDGEWGQWSRYSACSVTCGGGTKYRDRVCDSPARLNGGRDCEGNARRTKDCSERPCAVDGEWGQWSAYSACSVTCDEGTQYRDRVCDSPARLNGGRDCEGNARHTRDCSENPCSVWGEWGRWSECSHTCEEGHRSRSRECLTEQCTEGHREQFQSCVRQEHCPIDGGWDDWSIWYPCSHTCGGGRQVKVRHCDNPAPQHGGMNCVGEHVEERGCSDNRPCPVDGEWGQWSRYSACSVTCDEGTKHRDRVCDSPAPLHGGSDCEGVARSTRNCFEGPCAIDGRWSAWTPWSQCSVTCGLGERSRARACDNPAPANEGRDCEGPDHEQEECYEIENCPIDGGWIEWTEWGRCRARPCTGERGYAFSSRSCTNPRPQYGGQPCIGRDVQRKTCYNNNYCPGSVDGVWCAWQTWSPCNRVNFRTKKRTCECPAPYNRGDPCEGDDVDGDDNCQRENGSGSGGGGGGSGDGGSGADSEDQEQ